MDQLVSRTANYLILTYIIVALLLTSTDARGDIIINLWEDGVDVRGQASGALDISGLTFAGNFLVSRNNVRVQPNYPMVLFHSAGSIYFLNDPTPVFGSGGQNASGTFTGDPFGIEQQYLIVPTGFTSGDSIFSEGLFSNQTLASLGANVGEYTYLLPNDSVYLVVGQAPAVVPEPTSLMLFPAGTAAVLMRRRRRTIVGT